MIRKMIPVFLKIIKFFLGIVSLICLFILFMVTAMASVPYLTGKYYTDDESPSYIFRVVLESLDSSFNQPRFKCVRWDDFKKMQPLAEDKNIYISRETYKCRGSTSLYEEEYTAYLSVSEGSCDNISSNFKVHNVDAYTQVVRLRWAQEAVKARNSYRLDANTVIPIYSCKFMSAGIAINIFLVIIIALPLTAIFFRFCHKKYGYPISAGIAFILVGISALNLAVFNRRLSVDQLTENPEFFIFRMKILFIVSGFLFACAASSFWFHKKKRLKTSEESQNLLS